MVEGIHGAIIAFLRTSEHGAWSADTDQQNDEFNLHFIRGNWKKSLFGSKRVAGVGGDRGSEKSLKPMLLSVTIRPAPCEMRIGINHSVFYKTHIGEPSCFIVSQTDFWQGYVDNEAKALRDYLHQFYSLESPPLIESI